MCAMSTSPKSVRTSTRLGILLVSTLVGLIAVEWGLRHVYRSLPSINGLRGSEFRLEWLVDHAEDPDLSVCHEIRSFLSHRSRWTGPGTGVNVHFNQLHGVSTKGDGTVVKYGSGEVGRTVWVAGDSLAYGLGVEAHQTFGAHLGRSVARQTGGAAYIRNLSVPGAGYCTVAQRVVGALKSQSPDVVMLALSADDLEDRLMLSVNNQLIAPPDLAESRVGRWLVKRSWLANLAWFRWLSYAQSSSDSNRFIGRDTQEGFRRAMGVLKERIEDRGGRLVVAIVEPPGMPMCSGALNVERCGWLREDMATMSALLDQAHVPHTVVSGLWSGRMEDIVREEREIAARGVLAMHPSAEGHERIGQALWPLLAEAM
jgi:lysophospholipase L1-like esterase